MEKTLDFLIATGKLKTMKRRGWVLRGIKDPESIAAHTFRMAIMSWVLCCDKRLNVNKVLKMSLIHDLCEVYAGDTTPYDMFFVKDKKKMREILKTWPRLSQAQKEKFFSDKYKKENRGLNKLIEHLPPKIKAEIKGLWDDYEKGITREGRFVRQLDRMENLLQAMEYWKAGEKLEFAPWWVQIEELIDDPVLLELMKDLEKKFHAPNKSAKKR